MPNKGFKSLTIRVDAKALLEQESRRTGTSESELARQAILDKYSKEAS